MYTENIRAILLHCNGNLIKFTKYDNGLYLFDTAAPEKHRVAEGFKNTTTKQAFNNYSIITTIYKKKYFYTQQEIEGKKKAIKTQQIIGWPSTAAFKNYIKVLKSAIETI